MVQPIQKIYWSVLLGMVCIPLLAQSPNFRIHKKVKDGELRVRWEALQPDLFIQGIDHGYKVQLYAVEDQGDSLNTTFIEEEDIRTLAFEEWTQNGLNSTWDTIVVDMIYPTRISPDELEERYPSDGYEAGTFPRVRQQFGNYAMSFDFDLIQKAGFGYRRPLDPSVGRYAIKVYPLKASNQADTLWIDLDANNYREPTPAQLEAEFKDSRVDLKWRTKELRRLFFGYQLERSDNGQSWRQLNEQPFVNVYDTTTTIEAFKYSYWIDTFSRNNQEVTYRLRGLDYLGDVSETYSEVKGSGYDEINYSPAIYETVQTDSNYAIIKWDFEAEYEPLLKEFQILHTDTLGGIYQPILVGIAPDQREASIKMQYRSNFYRVMALPHRGPAKSSFESLVMAWDEDPPAQPQGFEGTIDSSGIIRLKWLPNSEEDLGGYRVFKSYFKEEEFAGITPTPLTNTSFTDTVDMETSNEWVYYQIQANDLRGNRSAFTNILALKKVDIIPPPPPQFKEAKEDGQQINLSWFSSPAQDLASQRLFRRIIEAEDNWTLIEEFPSDRPIRSYQDQDVRLGPTYAYTMTAIDDDGLESDPAQIVVLKLTDYGIRPAINNFRLQQTEQPLAVQLSWDYDQDVKEFWLYKASGEDELSLMKVIPGNARSFVDQSIRRDQSYRYVIRALFTGGAQSPYTEVLDITVN